MASRSFLVLLLLLLASTRTHGQDLDRLQYRVEQLAAHRDLKEEFSEDLVEIVQEAVDSLKKLWTDPSSVDSVIDTNNSSIPWNCLWAAWNLTHYKDSLGLPATYDVLDSFGKLGPGELPANSQYYSVAATVVT